MVLSNAERQERYRQRLKARASGADLAAQAQQAVDASFAAYLAIMARPTRDGRMMAGLEEYQDAASFQRSERANPNPAAVLAMFNDQLEHNDPEMMEDERAALERGAAIYRAALLEHIPAPIAPNKRRKTR